MKMLEQKYVKIGVGVALVIVLILFFWLTAPSQTPISPAGTAPPTPTPGAVTNAPANTNAPKPSGTTNRNTNTKVVGFTEKRTPHLVSTNVANNATLAAMPATITLSFNAPITKSTESFITVKRDQIYSATSGSSFIGGDGKTLVVNLNQQVTNGDYYVYYVSCFADTSCSDGRFGFHLKLP